ncbi:30S ribosomal protein S9 [Coprothermobacteraceae bacterium]|nr:30S ribosomal protein S9 [Coprothermobacteraceae bacterium]
MQVQTPAVGRRKRAVARIRVVPGSGRILVNGVDYKEYFHRITLEKVVEKPLEVTGTMGQYDVFAKVEGGGKTGQADAIRLGIARALVKINPEYRKVLRQTKLVYSLLTRDPREKERKKYGLHRARRARQYRKR